MPIHAGYHAGGISKRLISPIDEHLLELVQVNGHQVQTATSALQQINNHLIWTNHTLEGVSNCLITAQHMFRESVDLENQPFTLGEHDSPLAMLNSPVIPKQVL